MENLYTNTYYVMSVIRHWFYNMDNEYNILYKYKIKDNTYSLQ